MSLRQGQRLWVSFIAFLLEHGHVVYAGKPNDFVNLYSKLLINGNTTESLQADIKALRDKNGKEDCPSHNTPTSDLFRPLCPSSVSSVTYFATPHPRHIIARTSGHR